MRTGSGQDGIPPPEMAARDQGDRQVDENVFLDRFMGQLATALAVLATLLAVVGG